VLEYRLAISQDAPSIAALHADNWRRTYRGNFSDAFLDDDVLSDRENVWKARLSQPAANQYVCVGTEGDKIVGFVCVYGATIRSGVPLLTTCTSRSTNSGVGSAQN
jgi:hypothetical protein